MDEKKQKELRKAFIDTIYETLEGVISPTPYLELIEQGGNGDKVQVNFLKGMGNLPKPNSAEVTVLDLDVASLFFDDIHLLYEGVTGVGKTFTGTNLFRMIFGEEGFLPVRLTGGLVGTSAISSFTKTVSDDGLPRVVLDKETLGRYGAIFMDEINRGDPNETFQIADGELNVNGELGRIGIPIPGTQRVKRPIIMAALNPPNAQYNGTIELDLAGESRFLRFIYPNGVAEAATSQLEKRQASELYKRFWGKVLQKTGMAREFSGLEWKAIYPQATDPEQFKLGLDGRIREFIDVALGYVGEDPKKTYQRNTDILRQEGIDVSINLRDDEDYRKVVEAQGKLKHGFVRRDLSKIYDISRMLAFIKSVKMGTYEPKIGINEVSAAIGVVLESKVITDEDQGALMTLVNDARTAYESLYTIKHEQATLQDGKPNPLYNKEIYGKVMPDQGIRQAIMLAALQSGKAKGFEGYDKAIQLNASYLNTARIEGPAIVTIKSRLMADMATLRHLGSEIQDSLDKTLKIGPQEAYNLLKGHFNIRKNRASVYEHRLGSLFPEEKA